MADRTTKKKPPPDDPNKAAKALVDQVAALTEDGEEKHAPETQDDAEKPRS